MKSLSITIVITGFLLATVLVGWYGVTPIAGAMLSVGWQNFALFCAWQACTVIVLATGWRIAAPLDGVRQLVPFVWGRAVRDAAGSCLPFSQVGGFVLGVRAVTLHGISWPVATLSMIVDLTAEFVAEIAFAAAGLLVLVARSTDPSLGGPIVAGLVLALVAGGAVLRLQQKVAPLLIRFGRRVHADWFARGDPGEMPDPQDLAALYCRAGRMALCIGVHLAGWVCKGVGNWIVFRMLWSDIDLVGALAIEALLHALLIPAFIVPGYAGVQEAGYAGVGALFGIPPEISLSVSLLRRARDLAIGTPVLLLWQLAEMRHVRLQARLKPRGAA